MIAVVCTGLIMIVLMRTRLYSRMEPPRGLIMIVVVVVRSRLLGSVVVTVSRGLITIVSM